MSQSNWFVHYFFVRSVVVILIRKVMYLPCKIGHRADMITIFHYFFETVQQIIVKMTQQ